MKTIILWTALLAAGSASATTVYSNITTDTFGTVFYSTGPYTQIGDQITLSGTDRAASSASVQLYNNGGSAGTFDATLRFFNVGSPVGGQLGGNFSLTGQPFSSAALAA